MYIGWNVNQNQFSKFRYYSMFVVNTLTTHVDIIIIFIITNYLGCLHTLTTLCSSCWTNKFLNGYKRRAPTLGLKLVSQWQRGLSQGRNRFLQHKSVEDLSILNCCCIFLSSHLFYIYTAFAVFCSIPSTPTKSNMTQNNHRAEYIPTLCSPSPFLEKVIFNLVKG